MAAIVTKLGSQIVDRSNSQKRVARVSAKKAVARQAAKSGDDDEDIDTEALAGDDEEVVVEKKPRPDSGTYLSMYFRDMATLDVLRPEEEFTSAREIETLEIMLWEAVLAHAPAVEHVLAAVALTLGAAEVTQLPTEARALRKAAEAPDAKAWPKLVARAARRLRADDVDHLFIDAALGTIDRITVGIGTRGNTVGSLGRERARAEWMRRVMAANRAAAERATTSSRRTSGSSSASPAASTTAGWRSPI